jgi:hypothetical protein
MCKRAEALMASPALFVVRMLTILIVLSLILLER